MKAPARTSAGLLMFRRSSGADLEVLLGHMGGPFWARKDDAAWSIPKGEPLDGEKPFETACREFTEELGLAAPTGEVIDLGSVKQSGGKVVSAWAVEGDADPADVVPGTFTMEWPPRSGRFQDFPEVDRVAWFTVADARVKLVRAQVELVERLEEILGSSG